MSLRATTKHRVVRDQLEQAIRRGEFVPGEQLPAEQELAQRFGVSYMTARQAVSDLVAAEMLERRARKGTFVRHQTRNRLEKTTLNLITSAYESLWVKEFLSHGMQAAEKQGWNVNLIRLTSGQQDPAVRVIQNGELAMVMLDEIRPSSALGLSMRAAKGKAIAFHRDLSSSNIPSILSELTEDLRIAVHRLRHGGHTHIAVVSQFPAPEEGNSQGVAWQQEMTRSLDALGGGIDLVRVKAPLFHSPIRQSYTDVLEFLTQHPRTTALITRSDEIAVGTLAACRDAGRPVPEKISLINQGDTPMLEFLIPPVTCIDNDFRQQFKVAVQMLEAAVAGTELTENLFIVSAHLIERGSVGPAAH